MAKKNYLMKAGSLAKSPANVTPCAPASALSAAAEVAEPSIAIQGDGTAPSSEAAGAPEKGPLPLRVKASDEMDGSSAVSLIAVSSGPDHIESYGQLWAPSVANDPAYKADEDRVGAIVVDGGFGITAVTYTG